MDAKKKIRKPCVITSNTHLHAHFTVAMANGTGAGKCWNTFQYWFKLLVFPFIFISIFFVTFLPALGSMAPKFAES